MKPAYSLRSTKIVPSGGFVAKLPSGTLKRATHHETLLNELRFFYPDETREQHSKRINDDTCEYLVSIGAESFLQARYPSLQEQGDVVVIPNGMLLDAPHNYNNGLFSFGGELIMCYRRHLENAFSEIAICEIDRETLLPLPKSRQFALDIPKEFENEDHEDARIFWHGEDIYVSYTMWRRATLNGRWLYMPRIDVAVFDAEWQFKHKFTPKAGGNGKIAEKNWTFFSHDDTLYFVYDFLPFHQVFKILKNEKCELIGETKGIQWNYGTIRGSTPPQRISDTEYLSFFHSRKRDEAAPFKNRYYAGAYCFEAKEPFRITRYTEEPVFAGSESNQQWDTDLACVFPCGLVIDRETALVSMGSNDMECAIGRVNIPQLLETMTQHDT